MVNQGNSAINLNGYDIYDSSGSSPVLQFNAADGEIGPGESATFYLDTAPISGSIYVVDNNDNVVSQYNY